MDFKASEAYLLSLGNEVAAMKLGLDSIRTLLKALGDPQNSYLKVQVAGTNGKGSVCAFLDSICRTAGLRIGLYTSPHLVSITERVRISGENISEAGFARSATLVRETSEHLVALGELLTVPTFFEQVTAIALVAFAEAKIELAILETGLGGRLDATTAANAELCAITRIDYDHQQYLGDTIEEIAAEKAAIIRPDSYVVIGQQCDHVSDILLDRCRELGVVPQAANKSYIWTMEVGGDGTQSVSEFDREPPSDLGVKPGLPGRHQIENAYTAVMIAGVLANELQLEQISEEDIRRGIESAQHAGRLEYHGRFLFDGAHNPGGAKALASFLDEFEHHPITLLFGAMEDKPIGGMLDLLVPRAAKVVLTQPSNERAVAYEQLLDAMPAGVTKERTFVTDTVAKAIDIAETITPENGLILVTGSLYLIGEVKRLLSDLKSQI